MRVADYIAEFLERKGVTSAFLLAGGGMMHLMDAVGRRKSLHYVCNHHEQACAMAADGYARKSGKVGVVYATSGPGATNTITGIVNAHQDSVPMIVLTGQSKLVQTIRHTGLDGLRQYGTFEADIVPIVRSITKYAAFLDDPKRVRYEIEKAYAIATSGRPGVVLIDVPVDIQGAPVDPDTLRGYEEPAFVEPPLADAQVDGIIERLKRAKRPLILAGHGVRQAGAAEQFARVAQRLNVPVATTCLAIDLLEYEHPLFVGHPGMKGDRPGNFAVQTADVIVTVGSSLHVLTTGYELDQFAKDAWKIQVEIDPLVMQREQVGVQEKVHASVQSFLTRLEARLPPGPLFERGAWHARCESWKRELAVSKEPHKHEGDSINYYDLSDALSDLSKGDETIVADAGSAFYVIGQAFRVKRGQRVIISGATGTMGFAVPATTGACVADRAHPVICVTGDGSLQTNLHELGVIAHNKLDAKIFIVNNDGYVSIRNTQNNFFGGYLVGTSGASGVSFPRLDKLCEAWNLPYAAARSRSELRDVVARVLATPGPIVCEVFTPPTQEIIPTVSSVKLADGRMKSKPLHDMAPFMDEATLRRYLEVPR